jgi:hypothetical protein
MQKPLRQDRAIGFAKIYGYGKYKSNYWMAMDLLGPTLSDLFCFCGKLFSLKTTIIVGL